MVAAERRLLGVRVAVTRYGDAADLLVTNRHTIASSSLLLG